VLEPCGSHEVTGAGCKSEDWLKNESTVLSRTLDDEDDDDDDDDDEDVDDEVVVFRTTDAWGLGDRSGLLFDGIEVEDSKDEQGFWLLGDRRRGEEWGGKEDAWQGRSNGEEGVAVGVGDGGENNESVAEDVSDSSKSLLFLFLSDTDVWILPPGSILPLWFGRGKQSGGEGGGRSVVCNCSGALLDPLLAKVRSLLLLLSLMLVLVEDGVEVMVSTLLPPSIPAL
jgi:hypothetical protein